MKGKKMKQSTLIELLRTNVSEFNIKRPTTRITLSNMDLSSLTLHSANLSRCDIDESNFSKSDLSFADLNNVYGEGATFQDARLYGVDLRCCAFDRANFQGAYLRNAQVSGASFIGANFRNADLIGVDFLNTDLRDADLTDARLPYFQICPEVGSFVAYKRLEYDVLATLEIPGDARRTSSLVGRKCRAEFAKVIALSAGAKKGISRKGLVYHIGEMVYPDAYDPDIRFECTNGIHFFMMLREAVDYVLP